ncbi:MAG: NAD-dependent succinate-semialdehyde dehydrogenase [Actinobacteria bacterium]|jgi:succinate-semialdehyde dehydrogenase/glutarate-semialdehyde dehydrogenase|nr:NAD-dependent succinate-semialdehyde dehydrogenase [Actinomycetota bacterium]
MSDVIAKIPTDLSIGGKWQPASDGERFDVHDPATGEVIASVASGSADDATAAVAAADEVAKEWRETPPRERAEVLRRAYQAMIDRRDEIAEVIVRESGKAWSDAIGEVNYSAEFYRWYGEEAVRAIGGISTAPGGDKKILALHRPVGVSVLVTPWNFPAAMATRKIGPALAAGCTVVLKPASDTPLTALLLGEMMTDAGAPAGVVNVIPSRRSGATVGTMLQDSRVRKVSFTGSTEVGRMLLEQAAQQILNCSMELGGNAPFVVFEDADLDAAVEGAMIAKMRNGGESCIAANRFLVHERVADEFSQKLAEAMGALKLGPGLDKSNDVGPVINEGAREEIAGMVDQSASAGAKVLVGGKAPSGPGWFYEPTVLSRVDRDDPLLAHEIFGPVAPVTSFSEDDEAIELANATEFGLAAYVYSGDLGRGLRTCEAIEAGIVGLNRGFVSDPAAPFGGMKQSGLGREGAHDGLLEFMETQYIAASW